MLVIHHLGMSQSERVIWLCEELDLPYELRRYDRDAQTRLAPPELKALHPFGTAPILDDGPIRLAESGAIVEYVINRHGGGRLAVDPAADNYAAYLYWSHFANGSLVPAALIDGIARRLGGEGDPVTRSLQDRLDRAFSMVEDHLSRELHFAGDAFTAADILMMFPLSTMRRFSGRSVSELPSLRAYLARIGERPAFRRAMEISDPGVAPKLD